MKHNENINLPNALSFSRIILGIAFLIIFIIINNKQLADKTILILEISCFVIFIVAIITDALDGYFARRMNIVTDFGKHFDPLTDSVFFIIVFFSFVIWKLMPWYLFVIVLFRELFMHLYLRPVSHTRGKALPANIFGKIKTFCQSIFSMLILAFYIYLQIKAIKGLEITNLHNIIINSSFILFLIITLLSVFSLIVYLIAFIKDS